MLVRQLEDEVVKAKTHASQTNPEVRKNRIAHFPFQWKKSCIWLLIAQVKAHLEALQVENDHLTREIAILRETVKVDRSQSLFYFVP